MTYPDGMNPRLSPVYDVVPTVLYMKADNLGLNLNGSKGFEEVTPGSFYRMGAVTEYGVANAISRATNAAERVLDSWSLLKDTLPTPQYEHLTRRLTTLPLAGLRKE